MSVTSAVRAKPKRVVFAEGEDEAVIRAAFAFQNSGLGKALLVGRADVVRRGFMHIGLDKNALEIRVPLSAQEASPYIERLYKRIQRRGALFRDALSQASIIAAQGEADAARFRALGAGADSTHVTGDLKFDLGLPEGLTSCWHHRQVC